jgi:hypothetical protein
VPDPLPHQDVVKKLRPMRPSIFKEDDKGMVGTLPSDTEFFEKTSMPFYAQELADLDNVIKNIHNFMPDVDTESLYLVELDKNIKVFLFLMLIGSLAIISILMTIW